MTGSIVKPTPISRSQAALIRSLHDSKGRKKHGAYLAEGERIVSEIARSPAIARFVFATSGVVDRARAVVPHVPIVVVDKDHRGLFATEHSQGIGAVVELPDQSSVMVTSNSYRPLVHLEAMSDPGNLGTIVRTADWFGHEALSLGVGSSDPFNPKAVRASMGGIFRLPLALGVTLDALLMSRRPLFALDVRGTDIRESPLPSSGVYIVGSEAHGLTEDARSVSTLLSIRGGGGADSLNAATAAAILMYELSLRRTTTVPTVP